MSCINNYLSSVIYYIKWEGFTPLLATISRPPLSPTLPVPSYFSSISPSLLSSLSPPSLFHCLFLRLFHFFFSSPPLSHPLSPLSSPLSPLPSFIPSFSSFSLIFLFLPHPLFHLTFPLFSASFHLLRYSSHLFHPHSPLPYSTPSLSCRSAVVESCAGITKRARTSLQKKRLQRSVYKSNLERNKYRDNRSPVINLPTLPIRPSRGSKTLVEGVVGLLCGGGGGVVCNQPSDPPHPTQQR